MCKNPGNGLHGRVKLPDWIVDWIAGLERWTGLLDMHSRPLSRQ